MQDFELLCLSGGARPASPPTLPDAVAVFSIRHSNGITCCRMSWFQEKLSTEEGNPSARDRRPLTRLGVLGHSLIGLFGMSPAAHLNEAPRAQHESVFTHGQSPSETKSRTRSTRVSRRLLVPRSMVSSIFDIPHVAVESICGRAVRIRNGPS